MQATVMEIGTLVGETGTGVITGLLSVELLLAERWP